MVYFKDYPEFKPNLTPKQVLRMGSFGGTYFRDIHSSVTGKNYKGKTVIKNLPKDWFQGLDIDKKITSSKSFFVNLYPQCCNVCLITGLTDSSLNVLPFLIILFINVLLNLPLGPANFNQRSICLRSSFVLLPK